jgi:hypothetical protein
LFVWTNNEDYAVLKSDLILNIYDTFSKENIAFPTPPTTLN